MSDKKKTPEELEALVTKGASVIAQAKTRIEELATKVNQLTEEKKAYDAQVEKAAAFGPEIVERLIKAGRLNPKLRDIATKNMANPVKVAEELGNVLALSDVPALGAPEDEGGDGEKRASAEPHPMQDTDDSYRQATGIS